MIEQAATAAGIDAAVLRIKNAPPPKQRGARYWQAFIQELRTLHGQQQAELTEAIREATAAQIKAADLQRQLCELQRKQPSTYELLILRAKQGRDELQQTYRDLCKELHPDKGGNPAEFRQMQTDYESILALISGERNPYQDLWEAVVA